VSAGRDVVVGAFVVAMLFEFEFELELELEVAVDVAPDVVVADWDVVVGAVLPVPVLEVATGAAVVPGISAATTVPIPAVPRMATMTMAAVVRRIRRARDRRPKFHPPSPAPWLVIASSFAVGLSAFDLFNVGGLLGHCVHAVTRL